MIFGTLLQPIILISFQATQNVLGMPLRNKPQKALSRVFRK